MRFHDPGYLAVLRDAGLVTMRVDGNFRRYQVSRDALVAVQSGLLAECRRRCSQAARS